MNEYFGNTLELVEQALTEGKTVRFTARGNSMEPAIMNGDEVMITRVNGRDVMIGDVLLVRWGNSMVLRRVVDLNRSEVVTKGDNRFVWDPPASWDQVLGRVDMG